MYRWITAGCLIIPALLLILHQTDSCNEAVCGSVVSKCLLTQSCKCDLKNCTCCKDCFNCLNGLYSECCSCVDMCPGANESNTGSINTRSHVEDFMEGVPELFKILTEHPDEQERWTSLTFPVDIDISQYQPKKEIKIHMQTNEQEVNPMKNAFTLNCTVAFMSDCMSWVKCKDACLSMGAASYRWFHNSCCECVGPNCINYGVNESRCKDCPDPSSDAEVVEEVEDYDFADVEED